MAFPTVHLSVSLSASSTRGASNESFGVSPAMTLQLLLEHCHDWMEGVDIDAEASLQLFFLSRLATHVLDASLCINVTPDHCGCRTI